MEKCIADKIMEARKTGVEVGQEKYRSYFVKGINAKLYKKYKAKIGTGLFMGYCLFTIFTFRFFVEFIKENQVAFEDGMTLIMGQWLSIPLIIAGGYFMIKGIKKAA